MITDIERVGDQSADIADLNIQLIKKKSRNGILAISVKWQEPPHKW